jgi:ubiquinone/menaquinone biosynthesis C-methylase UbiE
MNITTLRKDLRFWDAFAPWYEKWLNRGEYHKLLIREITHMIEPGWKVLDIGGGTGALALPMSSLGCTVTVLEPSEGMRDVLTDKLTSLDIKDIEIDMQRWEDFPSQRGKDFDLIIACDSLHLTDGGIAGGMKKAYDLMSKNVCLITEINQGMFIDFKHIDSLQNTYSFLFIRTLRVDSSFYFEDFHEVKEVQDILSCEMPVTMEGDRLVQRDETDVAIVWWEKK